MVVVKLACTESKRLLLLLLLLSSLSFLCENDNQKTFLSPLLCIQPPAWPYTGQGMLALPLHSKTFLGSQ